MFQDSSINGHQSEMAGAFCVERGVFMYPVSGAFLQAVQELFWHQLQTIMKLHKKLLTMYANVHIMYLDVHRA